MSKIKVLLVDDVYTTGARAQSAAWALQAAGASEVSLVVLARRLNPSFAPAAQKLWDELCGQPYSFAAAARAAVRGSWS